MEKAPSLKCSSSFNFSIESIPGGQSLLGDKCSWGWSCALGVSVHQVEAEEWVDETDPPISNSDRGEPRRTKLIVKSISWFLPLGQTVLTQFTTWLRNRYLSDGGQHCLMSLPSVPYMKTKWPHLFSAGAPLWLAHSFPQITALNHCKDFYGTKYILHVLWLPDLKRSVLLGSKSRWVTHLY